MIQNAKVIGPNVSYEVYSRQGEGVKRGQIEYTMSRSEIMDFSICPKRWKDGGAEPEEDKDTDATEWGSLIDTLLMMPQEFANRYAVAPAEYEDEKTGKMKPWNWNATVCKEWRDEQGDRIVLKTDKMEKAGRALEALKADADVVELIKTSQKQVMVVGEWRDKATGLVIPVRVLLDIVPAKDHPTFGKWLCDFKTARNGDPNKWSYVVDDCAYDVQAALGMDLYTAATKEDRQDWVFPVQENVVPYHVVKPFPALTSEFIAYGRAKYQAALTEYAACLASGKWRSYSTGDRLVIGAVQLIDPKTLYSYRATGGVVPSQTDYQPEQPKTQESHDIPT